VLAGGVHRARGASWWCRDTLPGGEPAVRLLVALFIVSGVAPGACSGYHDESSSRPSDDICSRPDLGALFEEIAAAAVKSSFVCTYEVDTDGVSAAAAFRVAGRR
jgi:hypothetical protein